MELSDNKLLICQSSLNASMGVVGVIGAICTGTADKPFEIEHMKSRINEKPKSRQQCNNIYVFDATIMPARQQTHISWSYSIIAMMLTNGRAQRDQTALHDALAVADEAQG